MSAAFGGTPVCYASGETPRRNDVVVYSEKWNGPETSTMVRGVNWIVVSVVGDMLRAKCEGAENWREAHFIRDLRLLKRQSRGKVIGTPPVKIANTKFSSGQHVFHVKTGGEYRIVETPDSSKRLEHCNEPFYSYQSCNNSVTWFRRQSEMEDGRFIPIDEKPRRRDAGARRAPAKSPKLSPAQKRALENLDSTPRSANELGATEATMASLVNLKLCELEYKEWKPWEPLRPRRKYFISKHKVSSSPQT